VDALQVGAEPTGVGRLVQGIGADLHRLPPGTPVELRCTREALPLLAPSFPEGTRVSTPLRRSRPRLLRMLYQQVVAPLRDSAETVLVCPGDQGPLRGRARVVLGVNDVRRFARPTGSLEDRYYRFLVPRAARRAAAVVTISDFSRGEIERLLGVRARVVAIHPAPRAEPVRGGDHLLVVGALRPYKGLEILGGLDQPREIVVAGPVEGPVPRGVRALGWVSEERLEELYETAFAVVCPSTYEGYGLPLAEALARGLPTVASDIPPHRESAGDAALYFPPGDAAALAECLRRVEAERPALAARALERARELDATGPKWDEIVAGLL
jgi:glycosyltransferase involved in cell wall biosynthesis